MNQIAEARRSTKSHTLSLQAHIVCEGGFTRSVSNAHPKYQIQPKSSGSLVLLR